MATTLILVNIGFASLVVGAVHWFGSVASALAYLHGDGLIPDEYTKSFGTATRSERPSVNFLVKNWTKRPIKVLGTKSSCGCLITSDLPLTVPPAGQANLRLSARAQSGLGAYSERVRVLTDSGESNLVLNVRGVFQ